MSFSLDNLIGVHSEPDHRTNSVLKIVNVDYCLAENGKEHRTSRYELMNRVDGQARLVIRRGQRFVLNLKLSRGYDPAVDNLFIAFAPDDTETPRRGLGNLVFSPILHADKIEASNGAWQAMMDRNVDNFVRIAITPAANIAIGKWRMVMESKRRDSKDAVQFTEDRPFYVLYNAWCKEDEVYLADESERQEYVLNDNGIIWFGTAKKMFPRPWPFAQYDYNILDCALYVMINIGKVNINERNDPVIVSRRLSAAVNCNQDNGVLVGNWLDDYSGGKSPTQWLGSQKILQQYYATKKPVKYGQCWVFAGVLASIYRSLGLPSRVVTNFNSGHDADCSLTIDYILDENGRVSKEKSCDSHWNFHVWVEMWTKRPDLTPDCHGWQVLDATPQELSQSLHQCGPASVAAIKRAEVRRPYDSDFVYAEVNADLLYWQYDKHSREPKLIRKDIHEIGQRITTKAVNKNEAEDITHTYKHPETSKEERAAVLKTLCQSESKFSRLYLDEFKQKECEDLVFSFELIDEVIIGQPFSVVLTIKNLSRVRTYQVSTKLRVENITYTGRLLGIVKELNNVKCIGPNLNEEVRLNVSWEEYGSRISDQGAFKIWCYAPVKSTNFTYVNQDDFCVRQPDVVIELKNDPVVCKVLEATARFTNPLPVPLKNGKFVISGPGLKEQLKFKLTEDVKVGGETLCSFSVTPVFVGEATITVKFYSLELNNVNGYCNFTVKH